MKSSSSSAVLGNMASEPEAKEPSRMIVDDGAATADDDEWYNKSKVE